MMRIRIFFLLLACHMAFPPLAPAQTRQATKTEITESWRPLVRDSLYSFGALYQVAKLCGSAPAALEKYLRSADDEQARTREYSTITQAELDKYLEQGKSAGKNIYAQLNDAGRRQMACGQATDMVSGKAWGGANGRDSFMSQYGGRYASPPK
jgi:hypothetical protein